MITAVKKLLCFGFLISWQSMALADVVTITPGSSATVGGTTVVCSGGNSQPNDNYCVCEARLFAGHCTDPNGKEFNYYDLKLKNISNPGSTVNLNVFTCEDGRQNPQEACEQALLSHPSCR